MATIIQAKNLSKIYKTDVLETTALSDVSFEIKKGEFVAVMGPSGSGKSTLMHIIGALDTPTSGTYILDGEEVQKLIDDELSDIRNRKIGFIFQAFNLLPRTSALKNVMLPMIFQGKVIEERRKRAVELLDVVGLKDRMYHKPKELSGGQMQRVAIARALANDPDVILADEPTGNLDSSTGHSVMNVLVNLNKKFGKTIIVVTHDPYIAKYAKRKVNILDGQIAHDHQFMKRFIW